MECLHGLSVIKELPGQVDEGDLEWQIDKGDETDECVDPVGPH